MIHHEVEQVSQQKPPKLQVRDHQSLLLYSFSEIRSLDRHLQTSGQHSLPEKYLLFQQKNINSLAPRLKMKPKHQDYNLFHTIILKCIVYYLLDLVINTFY